MNAFVFYSRMSGITVIMDILYLLWILPAVWAVEGKPLFHSRFDVNGRMCRVQRATGIYISIMNAFPCSYRVSNRGDSCVTLRQCSDGALLKPGSL